MSPSSFFKGGNLITVNKQEYFGRCLISFIKVNDRIKISHDKLAVQDVLKIDTR